MSKKEVQFLKIAKFEANQEDEKKYYLLAIQFTFNDNEKKNLYKKLLLISEDRNEIR